MFDLALKLRGQRATFTESISRSRDIGHDRHFATRTCFSMRVGDVNFFFSGTQMAFRGEDACYGISLDSVASYSVDEGGTMQVIEHFEHETERRTTITPR